MFDLSGRVALVTGASGGIGGAIVRCLHAQGASVVLSGRRLAEMEEIASQLQGRAHVVSADLTEDGAAESLARAAEAVAGPVDILVNNAGLTRDGLMVRMRDEDWRLVLEVDLTAAFQLTRACLKGMIRRRWGRVIAITSVVGATGNPGQANYVAAKAGLAGMIKALAAEVAPRGITANSVAPGFIGTAMTDQLDSGQRERVLSRVPAARLGTPDEVAAAVLFLASPEAGYITGQTVHVNGGMAML